MRTRLLASLLCAIAALACKNQSEPGYYGTLSRHGHAPDALYINLGDEPEYLDPGLVSENAGAAVALDLFEGLVSEDPRDLHPIQGVAERYDKSDDNRRYRFYLRQDARWSDGRAVTAGDFVYAWRRVVSPATGSRTAPLFDVIRNGAAIRAGKLPPSALGVRAVGDRVLDIELERPSPYLLELLSFHTFFPVRRDVVERAAGKGDPDRWTRPETIVTDGPFTLVEHAFRYQMVLEKNRFYWAAAGMKANRLVYLEVPSFNSVLALYQGGEIDFIGSQSSLPETYIPLLSRYRDFSQAPWQGVYWYELNTEKPPLDDARVRLALDLAIDKDELVARVTRGGQLPASHYVPDITGSGYAEAAAAAAAIGDDPLRAREWRFDPERARSLLRAAGYAIEEREGSVRAVGFPPLEILYNTNEGHRAIAIAVQDMWQRQLGISATLRNEEWKVAIRDIRDGNFQIARFGWVADYNHPHTYLETFESDSPNNWTRWRDPAFDRLVARAAATADEPRSIALYRQAELVALRAMPRLPLYFYTKLALTKPYLRGCYPNAMNRHPAQWMWIDPDFPRSDFRTGGDDRPAYPPLELPPPGRLGADKKE